MPKEIASKADFEYCKKLHKEISKTFYIASRSFPKKLRQRMDATYGFVRFPDEWVDNSKLPVDEVRRLLERYRFQLQDLVENGNTSEFATVRAFGQVVLETQMPLDEPFLFLEGMEMDTHKFRYENYEELQSYMRRSASAIAIMVNYGFEMEHTEETTQAAIDYGEALQLTNILRDIKEDSERGRIYLPQDMMAKYHIQDYDIMNRRYIPGFIDLMKELIAINRATYKKANDGIHLLPKKMQKGARACTHLYSMILDEIEKMDYNIYKGRASISGKKKMLETGKVLLGRA